jgi:hypothetical protein
VVSISDNNASSSNGGVSAEVLSQCLACPGQQQESDHQTEDYEHKHNVHTQGANEEDEGYQAHEEEPKA